jgi:hypothetical protein
VIPGIAGTESEGTSFRSVPERDILFQERLSHNATKAAALYVKGKSEVRGGLWATPVPGYRKLPVFRHFLETRTGTQVAAGCNTGTQVAAGCGDTGTNGDTYDRGATDA